MKAAVYYETGTPDVFRYEDVPDPVCGPHDILVDVEAVSIEGGDTLNRLGGDLGTVPHIVGYQCAGVLGPAEQHADRLTESFLDVGGRLLEADAGPHHRRHQVPLARGLLDHVMQEAEERRSRVVGISQVPGVGRQGDQTLGEDRLAQSLFGREVPVEGPDADARLLGDHVDGHLDALGREDQLGRLEDAGPVALGVGPERTRRGGAASASRPRAPDAHRNLSLPMVDKRNLHSV